MLLLGCMLALQMLVPHQAIAQVSPAGNVVFADDFTRDPGAVNPLSPWIGALGTWTITNGALQGSSSPWTYGSIYTYAAPPWADYTVEARIQFPAGAFGGGLGGRVNPATGARYGAWIYPDGSAGGSNVLALVKFRDWTTYNDASMQEVNLPSVGTGWHTLKMAFNGNRIQVFYDGTLMIDVTDNNYDSRPPYLSGGVGADLWTFLSPYAMALDDVIVNAGHEITRWKSNKSGAISLTFDDGYTSQYTIGVPALNELGFKGTFFLVTDFTTIGPPSWDNWRTAAGMGHEIGSHTKTHPYLTSLTVAGMQDEILGSQTVIDDQISSQKCRTFAYPYGDLNDEVEGIVESAYIAARGVRWGLNSSPFDLYNMYAVFPDEADSQGVTLESQVDLAEQSGQWMIAGFHGLDGTEYGPVTEERFRQFIGYVNTKNLWVDTFGSVVKYVRERGSANLSVVSSSSSQLVLNLTDGLDDATYDEALTIRSGALSGCDSALVTQGSSTTTVNSVLEGTTKVMYYNAVPDRGEITVSCNTANLPPAAMNDTYTINANTALNQPAPGVLSNDTDPEGATLTAQLSSGPSHGTLTLNTNGSFAYTPAANYAGTDSFTYTANDGTNSSNVATATITVSPEPVSLYSLFLNPTSVTGGSASQGTVTLGGPAPTGGVVVSLSDDSSAASVPASVTIPGGGTSATFTITTIPMTSSTPVTISAVYNGVTKTAALMVNPPVLSTLTLSPTSVAGGSNSQGTVTINGPAPSGGAVVTLSDNSSAASEPASVTVPGGSTSAAFTITTTPVASSTSVIISAVYNGVTRTATLTVRPPALNTLSLIPTSVKGGSSSQGTVTLSGPAPAGGAVVSLSDNSSSASEPASVTVPGGSTSATFTIATMPVTNTRRAAISAVYGGVTRRATLTVTP